MLIHNSTDCSGAALSGAPTNVGNYSVNVIVAAVTNKTLRNTKCFTHTITKTNTTTSMSAVTKTFNNNNQAASGATAKLSSNSSAISGAAFTYEYYSSTDCSGTKLSAAPKTAGSYSVKAILTGTSNYNSSNKCATYTMNKYKPSLALSAASGSVAWNSEKTFTATPTVITACKGKLTAASASTTYVTISSGASTTDADATSAVTVKWKGVLKTASGGTKINVNYTPTDTDNCLNADQKQYSATVTTPPPTVTLTAKTEAQRTYTGSAIAANTATVSPNSSPTITYKYYTNSTCTTGETTTAPTNVGTYYVKAYAAAVTGKTDAGESSCINHSIVKSNTTTSMSAVTKTFNNSNQAASGATAKLSSNSSAISGGSYTYTYYTDSNCATKTTTSDGSGATASGGAPKNADTYYVKATLAGTANYNTSTSGCTKYTMNKYKPTLALSATTHTIMWSQTKTFTATPTTITACKGTLTAASANTSYITIESGASTANATSAVSIKWKGVLKTTGIKINVNYKPNDTDNCAAADQKQYTGIVNVYDPITVNLTAKSAKYTGSAIAANTATATPNSSPTMSYTYYTNNTCTTKTSTSDSSGAASAGAAPKNVGTYYVIAHAAAVTNKTVAGDSDCTTHTITKKEPTMNISPTSGTLTYGTNGTITVTTDGDGTISCTTSDSTVATCSVSGKKVTVTPKANTADGKTATITVKQAAGTNYSAADNETYSVTVNRKTITCPTATSSQTKIYTGSSIASGVSCPTGSTAGGTTSATNVGSYSHTCAANSGYKFASTCSVDWSINNAKITFNKGTCTSISGSTSLYAKKGVASTLYTGAQNTTAGTIPSASKTGYTFNGWYTASSGGSRVINGSTVVASISGWTDADKKWQRTADSTLYAHCTANTYTIKFNGNGANTGSMSNQSMTYDVADNLTANEFTRYGYNFAGWNTKADGTGTTYANEASVKNLATSGTFNLYAKWTEKTYELTIDPRGGKYNGSADASVTSYTYSNKILVTKPKPTRANYDFVRWYYFDNNIQTGSSPSFATGTEGTLVYDNNNTGTGTIALQRVSGTNPVTFPTSSYLMKLTKSSSSTSATKPGLGGFRQTFTPSTSGRYVHVILARKTTSDPLYMQFSHNGVGTGGSTQWLTGNEVTTSWKLFVYNISTGTGSVGSMGYVYFTPTPVASGNALTGGFTLEIAYSAILDTSDNDNDSRGYGIGQYDGNGYLAATWTPKVYTITLNNQSATAAGTTTIYEKYGTGYYRNYSNGAVSTQMTTDTNGISVPTKTGYTFQGYYTSTNGTGKLIIAASGKLASGQGTNYTEFTSNGTLYAKWNKNSATTYSCRYVYKRDESGSPYCYVGPNYYTYAVTQYSSGKCKMNPGASNTAVCKPGTVIGGGWSWSAVNGKCAAMDGGSDWNMYTANGSTFNCLCSDSPTYHIYETITSGYMTFTTKPTACYLGTSCTVQCK